MWFLLIPVVGAIGKAVYDAVTDDSEEEKRNQARALARADARAKELQHQRNAKREEILDDFHIDLNQIYKDHKKLIRGDVPKKESANITFPKIKKFILQDVPRARNDVLNHLCMVVPDTILSLTEYKNEESMEYLRDEVFALKRLAMKFEKEA